MTTRNSMRFTCVIFMLCLIQQANAGKQEYFRWTDEHGVTNYGSIAPNNIEVKKIEVTTTKPVISEDTATLKSESKQKEVSEDPQFTDFENQRIEQCQKERSLLARLQINGRKRTQEDGYRRYLTRDEILQRIKEAQKIIREACS